MKSLVQQEIKKTRKRFAGASFLLLLAAIGLSVVWNRSIKEELAVQASHLIRKGILTTDMRGVRESLSGIQLPSFKIVTLYDPNGERVVTLPPQLEYRDTIRSFSFLFLHDSVRVPIYLDRDENEILGSLEFYYSRFGLLREAVVVWAIAAFALWVLLSGAIKKVQKEAERELKIRNAESLEEVARKVRHNIRSPLAVLKALLVDRSVEPKDFFEQCQSAISRLEEIVAEIKTDFENAPSLKVNAPPLFEVSRVVHRIVSEKRLIAGLVDLDLECGVPALYSEIPAADLRATLSNLIDNSLQAIEGHGNVSVSLTADDFLIEIKIQDTGRGIPSEIVPKLFQKGFSYQKNGGTGLGLYFAKRLVEDFQGNIEIDSEVGRGTIITLTLPRVQTPSWHLEQLDLSAGKPVIVCDDVSAIHKTWQMRFKELNQPLETTYLLSTSNLTSEAAEEAICLFDLDLGKDAETGLQFAERMKNRENFVLVTGNYDAPEVQSACSRLGCKLLPKDEIGNLPIKA